MTTLRAVLFDLDDTLFKTIEAKWEQHRFVAREHYGIELDDKTLAQHWGKPLSVLVQELYRFADTPENLLATNRSSAHLFPREAFPGAVDTMNFLLDDGLCVGVVTSTLTENAIDDLGRCGFPVGRLFLVQGEDAHPAHKPNPAVFGPALDLLAGQGIEAENVLYVGDSLVDLNAAKGANFKFYGVATGLFSTDELTAAGADATGKNVNFLVGQLADLYPATTTA